MRYIAPALAALLAATTIAEGDGWRLQNGVAGYTADDGGFAGLWLACANGAAPRLFVSTGGLRLQNGVDQTAVITVDGTAFLQRMRMEGTALRARLSAADARTLAGALAKGRKAEVSTPAGRFALPLNGSGKALEGLSAACG